MGLWTSWTGRKYGAPPSCSQLLKLFTTFEISQCHVEEKIYLLSIWLSSTFSSVQEIHSLLGVILDHVLEAFMVFTSFSLKVASRYRLTYVEDMGIQIAVFF